MNLYQINLVQTTFALIQVEANLFVTQLYDHLFRFDPCLCYRFPREMEEHNEKFWAVLAEIVAGLSRPYPLIQHTLRPLGQRHAGYGIQPSDYHAFGQALRLALADTLGNTFSSEVEAAWMEAYYLVAGIMKESGEQT